MQKNSLNKRYTDDPYYQIYKVTNSNRKDKNIKLHHRSTFKSKLHERFSMSKGGFKVRTNRLPLDDTLEGKQPIWYMENLCLAWMCNKYGINTPEAIILNMMYDMEWVTHRGVADIALISYGKVRTYFQTLKRDDLQLVKRHLGAFGDEHLYKLTHKGRLVVSQYRRYLYGLEEFPKYA